MGYVADVVNRCRSYKNEMEWFEFKQGTAVSQPDDIGEYISALSNAAVMNGEPAGFLIWGVNNDTHELTGTDFNYTKDINHEPFEHYLSRYVSPTIYFYFEEEIVEGERTVVLTIPAARIVPTAYREERWIRIGSSKEKLRKYPDREAALFRILNAQQNPTDDWERLRSKFHISDINRPLFDDYLKKAKEVNRITISSDEPSDVLNSIEIAEGDDLLNAAAAIFVESGINELQMVKFATDERLTIIDSKRYTGSILSLADKAVTYISDAMDWKAVFTGELRREEYPEVPMPAIREAVINAFAHRNIESRQAVDISIYKSYIDIYSPGLFPLELNPEDFIKRTIKPPRRNPLITKTLYYSRDMEAFATGFQRIDKACTPIGVKYEFLKEEYGFTVRFHRHSGAIWENDETDNLVLSEKGPKKGPKKGPEASRKSDEVGQRISAVYALIADNPSISRAEIGRRLGLSDKQAKMAIETLKEQDRIHREGSNRNGKWIID